MSNSSVRLDWAVEQFNRTCFESFKIFWFTNQTNSSYYQQSVGLDHRSATIGSLVPDTAYYFQVRLRVNIVELEIFTILSMASSWTKAPTKAFTFTNLLRHYAKQTDV